MASNTSKKVSIDTKSLGKVSVTMDKEDFDKISKYPLRAKTMGGSSGVAAYVVKEGSWIPLHRFVMQDAMKAAKLTEARIIARDKNYLDVRKKNLMIKVQG